MLRNRRSRRSTDDAAHAGCSRHPTLPGVAQTPIPAASVVELMGVRRAPLVTTNPRNPVSLAYAARWAELRVALSL